MTEQKGAARKERVGSLFFHLFHRLSVWIYTVLCNSLPARLLTSYETLELHWTRLLSLILGAQDGKLRRNLHVLRLRTAALLEHSLILRFLDRSVRFLILCPLNVYGIFFLIYGAIGAAVYFIAERLAVDYAGNIGWGISGIIIAIFSLPLLCSSKPLYRAAFGSRIVGRILRSFLGLEPLEKGKEARERGNTLLVYAALLLGAATGALTFFYHPATVPILVLLVAMAATVLYIPEAGVLLALGTVWMWWLTGYPAICAFCIAAVTLISYLNKLIRGKRVIHVRLMDFVVLMLGAMFAVHGVLSAGGALSAISGVGYAVLVAMYFPTVNLMRSREWLDRCYALLAISGSILAVISMLPLAQILHFLDMVMERVDLSMFTALFEYYDAYFGQGTMIGGILLLLIPIMLSGLMGKRTVSGFFWKAIWVLAGLLSVYTTMQFGVWVGFGVTLLLFFFTYTYRSLSASMLLAFPVACGLVWLDELERLLGWQNAEIVHATVDVVTSYFNGQAARQALARSVLRMSGDHLLGVGFGQDAMTRVFPYYASPGMESVTDMQNTYLQMLAEGGYLGLIVFGAVLLLFTMGVLTFLRWGLNKTVKARVAAGFAGVGGVLVMGWTCNLMNGASLFTLLWLVIALSVASIRTQYETLARAVQTHGATGERTDIAFRTK